MLEKHIKRKGLLVTRDYKYVPDPITGKKAVKKEQKEKLVVTVDNIPFDANAESINYMTTVISLAQYKATIDPDNKDKYLNYTLKWKCADNVVREVTVPQIAQALEAALGEIANIVGV